MKIRSHHFLAAVLVASASLSTITVASAAPSADKGASSFAVELEVAETIKGKSDTLQATLTIVDDRGCATLDTDRGSTHYEIRVCHQGGDAAAPVLAFEIARTVRTREAPSSQRFRVASKLATGQRVVVASLTQGDTATEVAAKVQ